MFGRARDLAGRRLRADERYALTMLGYAVGSRRSFEVAPQRPPLKSTRPLDADPAGARETERMFARESTC